jgi:large subunit ribosomal protein L30
MAEEKMIRVRQIKSAIGYPAREKRTLAALGLKKMHRPHDLKATPQVLGMVHAVKHLVSVEEL